MKFGEALEIIKKGTYGMRLPKWKPDVLICAWKPNKTLSDTAYTAMSHAYLYVTSRYGRVPWIPTQVEIFSDDWELDPIG